jgi:beta-fructofuranosidase
VYKPAYGGFVDMDIDDHKTISLRTLVSSSQTFRATDSQLQLIHRTLVFFFLFIGQIDHSVVESFGGGGRACITARVYPEHVATSSSHLYVFNNGSDAVKVAKLEAWDLATATVNVVVGDHHGLVAPALELEPTRTTQ